MGSFDDLAFADIDDSFEHTRHMKGAAFKSLKFLDLTYQQLLPRVDFFLALVLTANSNGV
jgi:hypothetical protein